MATIPGDVDADRGPPLSIPLRHFVAALGFLLAGSALGVADAFGVVPGLARLAHLHLLLVGFVCLTIAGAMTQFVPVWSGTALYSRRLARAQLWLIAGGVVAFAAALLTTRPAVLPVGGGLLLAGLWTLAYNVGRTLATARPLDVTERHFAIALAFVVALTALGVVLAAGFVTPVFGAAVARPAAVATHATLAVFGAVLDQLDRVVASEGVAAREHDQLVLAEPPRLVQQRPPLRRREFVGMALGLGVGTTVLARQFTRPCELPHEDERCRRSRASHSVYCKSLPGVAKTVRRPTGNQLQ